jgi:HAD superfamily hydrolase (TIGR01459 family)
VIILQNLEEIADRYDAVFCDVWGVVHNGRQLFPGAADALMRFRGTGKSVILLTNVPKPRDPIPAQLDRLGLPRRAYDEIVTSGDAIRAELSARAPGPMFKIGPARDAVLWDGLNLAQAPLEAAAFIGISGLNRDDEEPELYADVLARARERDLEMLCANPDIVVRVGDDLMWCAGAVARDYAKLGGRVVMAGKPHPPIYACAFRELEALRGPTDRARVLCVGDGVPTDIRGANQQGLDCLFIASGMHGEALFTAGLPDAEKIAAALAEEGVHAQYVMAELR